MIPATPQTELPPSTHLRKGVFGSAPMKTKTLSLCLFLTLLVPFSPAADAPVDWERAQQLHRRASNGEKLTPEEQAYYERAKPKPWTQHLIPLTELGTAKYKDQDGGLYGGGRNEPPKFHRDAAMKESAKVQPLDEDGKPSQDGKIGLLSVGMSNTTMEYSRFKTLADADPAKSPRVVVVDGAQGGQTGTRWADAKAPLWTEVDNRLQRAGVSPPQVQVVWMKQAEGGPARHGEFPKHAQVLKDNLVKALGHLKQKFPNLRLVYLSSRIYAGYATTWLNPEPFAYEEAFSMRWVIQDQIAGQPELNYDPAKGEVKSPLLLWGPYLWADGETPRKADGLIYKREDLAERDGTHPSEVGRQKVAEQLLKFLKSDVTAKPWFAVGASAPRSKRALPKSEQEEGKAALQSKWVEPTRQEPAGAKYKTFASKAAKTEVSYLIYLPSGYDTEKDRRYPVLYFLPGGGQNQTTGAEVVKVLDAAIQAKKIPPLVIISVHGPSGTIWTDTKDGSHPVETVVVKDLVSHVDRTYRTIAIRAARWIEGFSVGGRGATHFGFEYPEQFGAVSILAGAMLPAEFWKQWQGRFDSVWGGDVEYFHLHDPHRLVEKNAGKIREKTLVRLYIGDQDTMAANVQGFGEKPVYEANVGFHQHLEQLQIPHEFEIVPGVAHSYGRLYRELGDKALEFWKKAFARLNSDD